MISGGGRKTMAHPPPLSSTAGGSGQVRYSAPGERLSWIVLRDHVVSLTEINRSPQSLVLVTNPSLTTNNLASYAKPQQQAS